ncbi:phosphoglucomutase/phosphomannomutase, alpha/beta/alpha domain I [Oesophagostomum dentatum]|uniref:Phosphoglucomutase/phosphomannomutase, alpha/beta/alpha domain I n=1 Tax=Oesophagostomum dentatum TaxID=61180 RepID=A0A0B1SSC0_OESDE|nr:phosphoglucomutase/phosphomannomutase, alpha/beta/alpha domain I [Oesophagostomum dentatum]
MTQTTHISPEAQQKLMTKVENWLAWDKNEKTHAEIAKLSEEKNYTELAARMNGRLLFGTAGIRARMEAGFGRLNDLTIITVTHGFARHVLAELGDKKPTGVAIGYDGRHNSKRFAELSANVFIRNGVPSWATIKLKCDAGLIITASHNPKEDNGYKAYWSNGAQVHPNVNKSDVYIINSAVSSQIVKTIAEAEGFKNELTLTGFKWMGNKAHELRSKGKTVILAWEESIGYMPGHTLDKVNGNFLKHTAYYGKLRLYENLSERNSITL